MMKKILFIFVLLLAAPSVWAQGYIAPGGAGVGARYRFNNAGPGYGYGYGYGNPYPPPAAVPGADPNTAVVGQPYYNYGYPAPAYGGSGYPQEGVPVDGNSTWMGR